MAGVTINGWTVGAREGSIMRESTFRGTRERGKSAQHRDGRRDKKRAWDLVACFEDIEGANALQSLAQGLGHVWSYKDGVAASTGAKPDVDSDVVFVPTGGRFDGHLAVPSLGLINHTVPVGDDWTVMAWVDDGTGNNWQHMVIRSDGLEFLDGVEGSFGIMGNILLAIQFAQLVNVNGNDRTGAAANVKVDELVILPWYATDEQIEDWAAYSLPFSPLPFLDLSGDIVEDPLFVRVRGRKLTGSFVQTGGRKLRAGSAWRNNNVATGVTLVEREVLDVRQALPLPASYWTMDTDLSGVTVLDSMGLNDGAVLGTLPSVEGQVGEALSNTGSNANRIDVPSSASLNINGDLTICGWWNINSLGLNGRSLLDKNPSFGAGPYHLWVNTSGSLAFTHKGGFSSESFIGAPLGVPGGQWVHLAVTRGNSEIGLYVNGRLDQDAFKVQALAVGTGGTALRIGQTNGVFNMALDGAEDELAIYNQRMSSDQINLVYNLGLRARRQRSV